MNMKKEYWIAIVAIAVVVVVFGFSQYRVNHPALPQPLSTRGLPPPATDVPVVLPPDPGEAGKATLAGIDSDHDGVRDDLEREIVYMYPQNDQVRRVLRAMMKKEQDVITTTGDHEHFKGLMANYYGFENCWEFLIFGNSSINTTNRDILNIMLVNTPIRYETYHKNYLTALPFASEVSNSQSCIKVRGQY